MQEGQRVQQVEHALQCQADQLRWMSLVQQYQADAALELWAIYRKIAHLSASTNPPATLCTEPCQRAPGNWDVLSCKTAIYVYTIQNVVHYHDKATAKSEPWPILDKTLWPWSAASKPLPVLPSDAWGCILVRLPICKILKLALVCKAWKAQVRSDRHWNWRVLALFRIVPRVCWPAMPEPWQYFAYLHYHYMRPNALNEMTQAARNKFVLFLIRLQLPVGLSTDLKWCTKAHETPPANAVRASCSEWTSDKECQFFVGRVIKRPSVYYIVWRGLVFSQWSAYPNIPPGTSPAQQLRRFLDCIIDTEWCDQSLIPLIKQHSIFHNWPDFEAYIKPTV